MPTDLVVYMNESVVGELRLDQRRRFVFAYDHGWLASAGAIPLSLSLPLQEQPFEDDRARPFFANLLPEADVRRAVARRLGISEENDYALLEAIGGECAGAVSVLPKATMASSEGEYRPLSEEELHELVASLPNRPLLAGEEGIRLSLAGAQNKLPVYSENGRIFLPLGACPSSHILKPPIREIRGSVENEAFCMALAADLHLPVPSSMIRQGMDALYLVQRFDRERSPNGRITRVHQEDFCQALGVAPELKYEKEGGPSLRQCFELLRAHSVRPAADLKAMLQWTIFNYLIGNADAHAKNLSLLLPPEGPRLAPFYDLLTTAIYPGLSERLAMRIGGEDRPRILIGRRWNEFASEVGVKASLVSDALAAMAHEIVDAARALAQTFQSRYGQLPIVEQILKAIEARARSAILNLKAQGQSGSS